MSIPVAMVCECQRCGHGWVKRISGRPARCPKCKQHNWDSHSPGLGRPPKTAEKAKKAPRHIDPEAFRLWGLLKDFERWEFQNRSLKDLLGQLTGQMLEDTLRIAPALSSWLRIPRGAARKADAG